MIAINEHGVKEYLTAHDFPAGIQQTAAKNMQKFPIRFLVVDDSGSMATADGHRMIKSGKNTNMISCTRWKELVDIVKFQAGLAQASNALTEFRLLNNAAPIVGMCCGYMQYDNIIIY